MFFSCPSPKYCQHVSMCLPCKLLLPPPDPQVGGLGCWHRCSDTVQSPRPTTVWCLGCDVTERLALPICFLGCVGLRISSSVSSVPTSLILVYQCFLAECLILLVVIMACDCTGIHPVASLCSHWREDDCSDVSIHTAAMSGPTVTVRQLARSTSCPWDRRKLCNVPKKLLNFASF